LHAGEEFLFLFATVSRPVLGTIQHPIQWVLGALSPGVKRPGREAYHSLPSNAEVKNAWCCISTLPCVFIAWCLIKYREYFTFTFTVTYRTVLGPTQWEPGTLFLL
jgi:hypothetical protein